MKKLTLLTLLISHSLYAQVDCRSLKGCAETTCRLTQQLETARQSNDVVRISKVENDLKENQTNCQDKNPNQEVEQKIKDQKVKISGIESDLAKAHMRGEKHLIIIIEKKLNDEKAELQKLVEEK
jgi:uncharacterized protein (DUF1800 family)